MRKLVEKYLEDRYSAGWKELAEHRKTKTENP